ncbi:transposase [Oesophagostomum dentatum]|uniref:Transposase n=1 Tax=Oesophagostomum dentatum TaxID=61180 RepID=A0A0B1T5H2_OESDE|nr:transposase [Oesophagostomum dentatum]
MHLLLQFAQWVGIGEQAQGLPKQDLHLKKVMVSVWWNIHGVVHWQLLDDGATTTAKLYVQQLRALKAKVGGSGGLVRKIYFEHDNARPHIAREDRTIGSTIQENGLCYVTESANLLGLEWCIQLPAYQQLKEKYHCRLVVEGESKRAEFVADLKKQFVEVFKCKLGRCTKTKAMLVLKDNAIPIFKKKRPVPYASVPDLDKEIDRLTAEGVISTVYHSEWAAYIVVVRKKNGKIRLCADFSTELNDALQLHQHPLPTAEEVFTKPNGGQLFTQIDFAEAYL